MRLIDADDLKTREALDALRSADFDDEIEAVIDNIPTAYKVKAVVAAIKTKHCKVCRNIWKSKDGAEYCKDIECEIEGVCEIVRNGGKDALKGCGNCKHQPEPLTTCDWMKSQTVVFKECPRWERKE